MWHIPTLARLLNNNQMLRMNSNGRYDMKEAHRVALYGHGLCRSKFFTEIDDTIAHQYKGKCPNPNCNRRVALFPEKLFTSTDKARREYIKKARDERSPIYWQK